MSRVSKLVNNAILNGLLSPLKTPDYALVQIPKNHILNLTKIISNPQENSCFNFASSKNRFHFLVVRIFLGLVNSQALQIEP